MELGPNQKKWVAALRSGKFTQAKGTLQCDNNYCCLGVACRVAEENGIVLFYSDFNSNSGGEVYGGTLNSQHNVQDWLKLKSGNGLFRDISLVYLNDKEKNSFNQIADAIEKNANELFEEAV